MTEGVYSNGCYDSEELKTCSLHNSHFINVCFTDAAHMYIGSSCHTISTEHDR